jgi:hypothetical protein
MCALMYIVLYVNSSCTNVIYKHVHMVVVNDAKTFVEKIWYKLYIYFIFHVPCIFVTTWFEKDSIYDSTTWKEKELYDDVAI